MRPRRDPPRPFVKPQSNQRGIEIIVGLGFWRSDDLPQSNQRGIEILVEKGPPPLKALPQSNQRGIEIVKRLSNLAV